MLENIKNKVKENIKTVLITSSFAVVLILLIVIWNQSITFHRKIELYSEAVMSSYETHSESINRLLEHQTIISNNLKTALVNIINLSANVEGNIKEQREIRDIINGLDGRIEQIIIYSYDENIKYLILNEEIRKILLGGNNE